MLEFTVLTTGTAFSLKRMYYTVLNVIDLRAKDLGIHKNSKCQVRNELFIYPNFVAFDARGNFCWSRCGGFLLGRFVGNEDQVMAGDGERTFQTSFLGPPKYHTVYSRLLNCLS